LKRLRMARALIVPMSSMPLPVQNSMLHRKKNVSWNWVGIILTENPDEVEGWETVLDAIRHEPDPARLDRFLADLPGDNMKKQLSKWKG